MAMIASSWSSLSIQQELAKPAAWPQSWQIRCIDKGVVHKVPLTSSYVINTYHDELGPKCLLTRICEAHVTQTTLANVVYKFPRILINMLMTFSCEKKHIHLISQMILITKVLTPKIKARYYGILFQFKMETTKAQGISWKMGQRDHEPENQDTCWETGSSRCEREMHLWNLKNMAVFTTNAQRHQQLILQHL